MSYIPPNPNGQATSANSAPVVIASDQSAVNTKITNGTQSADTMAGDTGQNALLTAPARRQVSINVSSGSSSSAIDVSNFSTFSYWFASGSATSISIQGSNDNTDWRNLSVWVDPANPAQPPLGNWTGGNGVLLVGACPVRYLRISATGGNTVGTLQLKSELAMVPTSHWASQQGTWTVQPGNTSNTTSWKVAGLTAVGAVLTENPLTTGGLAKTTNPTAVSDGRVVASLHDKLGKQVVVGSIRDLKGQENTTITSSTTETTIVTAVAGTFLDLYGLVIANTSSTACEVTIKDATAGTTRLTFMVPANDTRGFMLPESAAHNQSAANNNWTATCGTSVASIKITALFVKNI